MEVTMRSDMVVKLIESMASDQHITRAAQVSVKGENNPDTDSSRLINYLMRNRHGSPFEHAVFTFFVNAPIFVFREFHRHRIASYNEMSGRYTKLLPEFYTPAPDRKLVNIGSSAAPEFARGSDQQMIMVVAQDRLIAQSTWDAYEERLAAGIANEVARTVLPVSIYSQMYVTLNARALMNFLSLRMDSPAAQYRSRPQWEIQMVAKQMEQEFANLMPYTYHAFLDNGRVSP